MQNFTSREDMAKLFLPENHEALEQLTLDKVNEVELAHDIFQSIE